MQVWGSGVHFYVGPSRAILQLPPPLLILQQGSSSSSVAEEVLQASVHTCASLDSIFIKFYNWRKAWHQCLGGNTATCWEACTSAGRAKWGAFQSSLLSPPEQVWGPQAWEVTEGFSGPSPRTASGGQSVLCGLGDRLHCVPSAASSRSNGNYFSFCIRPGPRPCATRRDGVINQFTRGEALVCLSYCMIWVFF